MIFTKQWWKGFGERAIKTWVSTFWATLFVQGFNGGPISGHAALQLPWESATITATVAVLGTVVFAITNADFTAGYVPPQPAQKVDVQISPDAAKALGAETGTQTLEHPTITRI